MNCLPCLLLLLCLSGVVQTLSFPGIRRNQYQPLQQHKQPTTPRGGKVRHAATPASVVDPIEARHISSDVIQIEQLQRNNATESSFLIESSPVVSSPLPRIQNIVPPVVPVSTVDEETQRQLLAGLQKQHKASFATLLACLAGVLDVVSFRKFDCFAHLMTGNTIRVFVSLTENRLSDTLFYGTMVAFYTAGATCFGSLQFRQQKSQVVSNSKTNNLLKPVPLILATILALSDVLQKFTSQRLFLAPMWAFCFGLVNAAGQEETGAVSNAVTGHWNKFGMAVPKVLATGDWKQIPMTTYKVIGSTIASIVATSMAANWLSLRPALVARLPPLGLSIGLAYFGIFQWYFRGPRLPHT